MYHCVDGDRFMGGFQTFVRPRQVCAIFSATYNWRSVILKSRYMGNISTEDITPKTLPSLVKNDGFVMFSKTTCPFCTKAKDALSKLGVTPSVFELDKLSNGPSIQEELRKITGQRTVPNIFLNGHHVGGCDSLLSSISSGEIQTLIEATHKNKNLEKSDTNFDYDLAVIGGGSGGLSCAKKAASLGAKVVMFDFVEPSPMKTKWGLGGTCVNVGCIPKKLMHQAAIHGENLKKCKYFGWEVHEHTHNWEIMQENINNYIRKLNFTYMTSLYSPKVEYKNAFATIQGPHKIKSVKNGVETDVSAKNIVICTGERPFYDPTVPGCREFCITSDDLFWMTEPPGKTLVVGASYVALECAGALHSLGYDVTVMVRSILLRGFDQEMANKIGEFMENTGVKFIKECVPIKVEPVDPTSEPFIKPKEVIVHYQSTSKQGEVSTDKFNTVLFAIGREPCTTSIGLDNLSGIKLDNKKRIVGLAGGEMTSVPGVYALGDILSGKPQLTPMAIQAGELLADRLFSGTSLEQCDYVNVPTTVFTPLEYSCVGYSEEDATLAFEADDLNVYHSVFTPLEEEIVEEHYNLAYYAKVIVRVSVGNKVIGIHYAGPNAGEVMQGLAVAVKAGITIHDLKRTVGIHPTCAEVFTTLKVVKGSGQELQKTGC